MIFIENRKKSNKTLIKLYPKAKIIDVTSKGDEPFVKLSPFYPHGFIPVPFSENVYSYSVEGIWQGLKVFENEGIDVSKFKIQNMVGIKRSIKKFGNPLGHLKGVSANELLDYVRARKEIFIPSYIWILHNKVTEEVNRLIEIALVQDLVLLDFDINQDIENISKPLSHASLIKRHIEQKHPELIVKRFTHPIERKKNKAKNKGPENNGPQIKLDI